MLLQKTDSFFCLAKHIHTKTLLKRIPVFTLLPCCLLEHQPDSDPQSMDTGPGAWKGESSPRKKWGCLKEQRLSQLGLVYMFSSPWHRFFRGRLFPDWCLIHQLWIGCCLCVQPKNYQIIKYHHHWYIYSSNLTICKLFYGRRAFIWPFSKKQNQHIHHTKKHHQCF